MANISQINGLLINAATASLAVTASFALAVAGGGGGSSFPFTGSALITGSLGVTGSTSIRGTLNQGSSSLASGLFSHVQGIANTASGIYSHAEGQATKATGQYSHAEGNGAQAIGNHSHAEGTGYASGQYSHAEGQGAAANGTYSHAEGWSTIATGQASHAEGQQTTATGNYSHTEGLFTSTTGEMSHAEGVQTVAQGVGSHAEGGWYYYDDGDFIFPGGTAAGNASHAEGLSTLASGEGAHAEGYQTTASGYASHAEGYYTIANGDHQHVQGTYNQTSLSFGAFIIGNGNIFSGIRSNLVFASSSQFQITGSLLTSGSSIISSQLTVGTSSAGGGENTLIVGLPPNVSPGEGGQMLLQASGGIYTSASMLDTYQNQFRILRGTNVASDALVAQWNLHSKQVQFPAYNSVSAFTGTAVANLAVDSGGNVITVSTSGGSVFPYTGNAVITGSLTVTQPIYSNGLLKT
jgi:hypothetical protein